MSENIQNLPDAWIKTKACAEVAYYQKTPPMINASITDHENGNA